MVEGMVVPGREERWRVPLVPCARDGGMFHFQGHCLKGLHVRVGMPSQEAVSIAGVCRPESDAFPCATPAGGEKISCLGHMGASECPQIQGEDETVLDAGQEFQVLL